MPISNSTQEDGLPSDLAEVGIHFAPTFTKSKPLKFLSLGLYEKLNQENFFATISQINERVEDIIESIPAEFLQRVIGEFTRRIRNYIVARGRLFEK